MSQQLRAYIGKLVQFALIGIGITILNSQFMAHEYVQFRATLPGDVINSTPAKYEGPVSWILMLIVVVFGAVVIIKLEFARYFNPAFYSQANSFSLRYLNDRIHEVHEGIYADSIKNPKFHKLSIISVLYALRRSIENGYGRGNVRLTLMLPEMRSNDERLFIQFWANETKATPITRRVGRGFIKGEGYAGYAWKTGKLQVGSKRIFIFVRDVRYVETSDSQRDVKSFLSIPIFSESPSEDDRPLIAVLNIDSTERFYFPRFRKKQNRFIDALRPFIQVLVFHLTFHDQLVSSASPVAGVLADSDSASLAGTNNEGDV